VFTGIVVEMGEVVTAAPALRLRAPGVSADVAVGDSVSVEGCCLTVTAVDGDELEFRAVPETMQRTMLADLGAGDRVNLEPALRVGDRMGGHWVQGHVDGVGQVVGVEPDGEAITLTVAAPAEVLRTTMLKGSITVSGVSLTVTAVDEAGFSVSLIPHTLAVTTLGGLTRGRRVNLEADVLGRYVQRLMALGTLPA
jgi:riboflavin synthase